MRPLNILLDLSGTLHIGDTPTPRAVASLTRLLDAFTRAAPRRCSLRFCSNTTKDSPTSLRVRLLRAGFKEQDVALPRLYTSLMAAAKAVKAHAQPSLLLLAKGSQELFEDTDSVRHFRPTADKLPASLGEAETSTLRACTTVVVGLAPELMRYEWLDEAYRILSGEYAREGAKGERKIIATHRALCYSAGEHLSMGPGAYIAALEAAARLDSSNTLVCGKPTSDFFTGCLRDMRGGEALEGERNIVIGDDVDADLGQGAIDLGLERVLVRTGKYRPGDEERANKPPSAVHDSFADWVDAFLTEEGLE